MKAIILEKFGGPDVFVERDLPTPKPSRSEVLVKIKASGFNPVDVKMRSGSAYGMELPKVLGVDFSGVIEAVGDPHGEFSVGDKVFGLTLGAYAEAICVPTTHIAKMPKNLSFEEAAVVPVVYLTAFQAMIGKGILQQDRPFFIAGGSGGVGTAAIQLARAYRGGPVFTTAGRPESRDYLIKELQIPGQQILDYRGLDLEKMAAKLIEMNGGSRFYFAFDCVGGKSKELCLQIADVGGHVATILPEDKSFPHLPWGRDGLFWQKSLSLHMIYLFATIYKSQLNALAKLFEKQELPPPKVEEVGSLSAESVQKGHKLLEDGRSLRKLVMTQSDSK
ncbi:MAG: NADP-dependent oxidoreductase [Verrucomicrobia bacterium]|nr:NADP-dependent oxidoreductase [Verrucomicrobiota bacterium]